jgi:hypothetical protein
MHKKTDHDKSIILIINVELTWDISLNSWSRSWDLNNSIKNKEDYKTFLYI